MLPEEEESHEGNYEGESWAGPWGWSLGVAGFLRGGVWRGQLQEISSTIMLIYENIVSGVMQIRTNLHISSLDNYF